MAQGTLKLFGHTLTRIPAEKDAAGHRVHARWVVSVGAFTVSVEGPLQHDDAEASKGARYIAFLTREGRNLMGNIGPDRRSALLNMEKQIVDEMRSWLALVSHRPRVIVTGDVRTGRGREPLVSHARQKAAARSLAASGSAPFPIHVAGSAYLNDELPWEDVLHAWIPVADGIVVCGDPDEMPPQAIRDVRMAERFRVPVIQEKRA